MEEINIAIRGIASGIGNIESKKEPAAVEVAVAVVSWPFRVPTMSSRMFFSCYPVRAMPGAVIIVS